ILFIVLDSERYNKSIPRYPKDWTLGEEQKLWFEKSLKYETDFKFVLYHHVLGGWPTGTKETNKDTSYGRGPLFTLEDYKSLVKDPNLIEQLEITRLMKNNGVRANFYGHDHVFNTKKISSEFDKERLYGICVGSPKYWGEMGWYEGDFWKRYYGDSGDYGGFTENADFWGPSGYSKMTIKKDKVKTEYIRSVNNHPHTNLPQHIKVGDSISALML
ncbi:hypothetical protein ACFLRM_06860, partial [Acidobacteriota bacterium]